MDGLFKMHTRPYLQFIILLLLLFPGTWQTALAQNPPVAAFTADKISGCAPLLVRFSDQSTGSPVFWNWDLGNGQLSTAQNPVASYSTPGTYSVTLVVRNANGTNGITKNAYITVLASPTANFKADYTIACLPAKVQFTDLSVPASDSITSWFWDFGDGSSSTLRNPTHSYTTNDFFAVTLRVTSSGGCQGIASKSRYIRVVPGVKADFSDSDGGSCRSPYLLNFLNNTSGPGMLSYQWDFGNGSSSTQTNPNASYASGGTYSVKLKATSEFGCSDTVRKNVQVQAKLTRITSPDSVCINSPISFQNASSPNPVSSVWTFGNGRQSLKPSDTSSYSTSGNYTVKLVNTYDHCSDSVTKQIYVRNLPTVSFTAPAVSACQVPVTVNFQNTSPGATSWYWDFGDGSSSTQANPSHTFQAEGNYDVTLTITDGNGCSNSLRKTAFIKIQKPVATITGIPEGICAGSSVSPVANVTSVDGVASYLWDFGDGSTSTLANPGAHSYAAWGNYSLKLTISSNGGCTASSSQVVHVGTPVAVDFAANKAQACASDSIQFTNLSGSGYKYQWDFGDGGKSDSANPSHRYTDTGYVDVSLTVINNGCPSSLTKPQLLRILPPVARFTASYDCINKNVVTFNNSSAVDPAQLPLSYSWDFGDGTSSTAANPSHIYASLQSYAVVLNVTNGVCSSNVSNLVQLVSAQANFSASKTRVCKGDAVSFSAAGSTAADVSNYEWFIQGVSAASGSNLRTFNYSFSSSGTYSVGLVITDIHGCTDTAIKQNLVTVTGPTALFNAAAAACRNAAVSFTDLSTGGIRSWTWDFGDGSIQNTSGSVTHQYADTGNYAVKLTVLDSAGCSRSYQLPQPIHIQQPRADFSANITTVCPASGVQFSNLSSGEGISAYWDFGNGQTSSQFSPLYSYGGNDSSYTVTLVVTDSIGCRDTLQKAGYIVTKKPKPNFSVMDSSSVCTLLNTQFKFAGQDYESFYWDFGDSSTSRLTNPNHFYNNFGSYTVKLYMKGYGGCLDSGSVQVNVYNPKTSTGFAYSPLNACNSLNVDFNVTPPPGVTFKFFAGGDGYIDSSQTKSFSHLYKTFGFYNPYLMLYDSTGCAATVLGSQTIKVLGALPFFGVSKKNFCDSGSVLFANYTISNDTVLSTRWDFGDGTSSLVKNPSHTFGTPGTYVVGLTANTVNGCVKTLTDTIRIYHTPDPVILADTVACIGFPIRLKAGLLTADTATSWTWDFGNGQQSADSSPTVIYTGSGTYPVSLTATNLLGCQAATSASIYVPPTPIINILQNPLTIPVGTGVSLPVSYGPGIVSYAWTPDKNLSCISCPNPFANPNFDTRYQIKVTDAYGCTNEDSLRVLVTCGSKNFFMPNTFTPNNDGHNDVFYPRGSGLTRVQSLRIYNRWGELVFERRNFLANDPSAGWNGQFRNQPAEPGVYVYIVEFVCDNGAIIPSKGNVALIR